MADEERTSSLPTLEDLESCTDLPVFEVAGNIPELEGPVIVGNNDTESLQAFIEAVDAKVVLVQYDYIDPMEYLIPPEGCDFDGILDDDEAEDVLDQIEARNDEIFDRLESDDALLPIACSVFVMYEGTPYGIYTEDVELIESYGETGNEFLIRIMHGILCDCEEDPEEDD